MTFDLREELPFDSVLPYIRERITKTEKWSRDRKPDSISVKRDILKPAVLKLLAYKSKNGEFHPIRGAEGHSIPFLDAWNNLAKGQLGLEGRIEIPNYYIDEVLQGVMGMFDLMHMGVPRDQCGKVSEDEAYELLVSALEAGNFETSDQECRTDGVRYKFVSEGWDPKGLSPIPETGWPHEKGPQKWVPIEPIGQEEVFGVEHLELEFESGELLVSCIINVEGFDELADPIRKEFSSSARGEIDQAHKNWNELGLIDIPTGNANPALAQEGGVIKVVKVGHGLSDEAREEKYAELDKYQTVSTARWCISMIDKQRLLKHLLASTGKLSEAQERLDEFIKKDTTSIIQVDPGRHHLYFGRNPGAILNDHEFDDVDTEGLDTFFILSKEELTYSPKPDTPLAEEDLPPGPKMR